MGSEHPSLQQLGWKPYFQQQLDLTELETQSIGRVIEQHRSQVIVMTDSGRVTLTLTAKSDRVCVGDWVTFDDQHRLSRVLERRSLFQRKAAGSKLDTQLIAANIDSVFIVCSLNDDFNLNRIERYLALAKEAEVEPIVVLTKADQCEEVSEKQSKVQKLDPLLLVHAINALAPEHLNELSGYCATGKTIALLGSSGVGKSTLVNGLMGKETMATGAIREDDSKGRHTTTYRSLQWLPHGGLLMDTPGMRELQLSACEQGISEAFSEITELAEQCKFSDCSHTSEPGCAILRALEEGKLEQRRLDSYLKLMREQAFNSATLAEKRAKDKAFGKMVNTVQQQSRSFKQGR
ncbi:ribosome small subunit-dependent GTPase A [Vibrio sinaloensis]|uniref:ribosome small subunit-dependent GTPase A n=1 Tax=Photobacterium sp. (strain ATCC 43367) TaxID=379097 RepID=UPI00057ED53A|nr:ribosome small subunit-dependent GTPase A [Vibrio sinaloensis]KHT44079.1 GTPase RsgA [Vibrio sinaloensis]